MTDYLLDSDNDLQIANGDFVKGESNRQHQGSLLIAEKGDYKQAPLATVGLASFLNDDTPSEMLREVRLRFSDDGMTVQQLSYVGAKLDVKADYGK